MAGVERFELPTVGFGDRCSTNWNYTPAVLMHYTYAFLKVKAFCEKKICSGKKQSDASIYTGIGLFFN